MPSLLTKIILFLSSYLPLWLIFAIQLHAKGNTTSAIVLAILSALFFLALVGYLKLAERLNPLPIKVARLNRQDGEAMSYIVTYLLPFIAMPSSKSSDLISLAIFIGVLAVLYVNSEMIHINPVLNLMRHHIYEVEKPDGHTCTVISKKKLRNNTAYSFHQIGDELFINFEK